MNNTRGNKGFGQAGLILIVLAIVLIAGFAVYKLFLIPGPVVTGMEGFEVISADKTVEFSGENLRSIDISIYQDGKIVELFREDADVSIKKYSLNIKPKKLKLVDGDVVVIVKAEAGPFKKFRQEIQAVIDTMPPSLDVLRSPVTVHKGGSGFVILKATGADAVYVRAGERKFPAFDTGGETVVRDMDAQYSDNDGHASAAVSKGGTARIYHMLLPAPIDTDDATVYYAVAEDSAGNQSVRALPLKIKDKEYKTSRIIIDDMFISKVVAPLLNEIEISDPVASFRKVNEDLRADSLKKIIEISANTDKNVLWNGRFLQLRNSKVMGTYGDARTYVYKGEDISRSVHLGYDLASYANAPVGAANSGIVRFAGDLSIYGNAVIIDHGLGLMSLYGHLSTIMVHEGQSVEKGDVIARTGSTGLAGGDHLHFGILINGCEVSPLYWWDARWLKNNIIDHMTQ